MDPGYRGGVLHRRCRGHEGVKVLGQEVSGAGWYIVGGVPDPVPVGVRARVVAVPVAPLQRCAVPGVLARVVEGVLAHLGSVVQVVEVQDVFLGARHAYPVSGLPRHSPARVVSDRVGVRCLQVDAAGVEGAAVVQLHSCPVRSLKSDALPALEDVIIPDHVVVRLDPDARPPPRPVGDVEALDCASVSADKDRVIVVFGVYEGPTLACQGEALVDDDVLVIRARVDYDGVPCAGGVDRGLNRVEVRAGSADMMGALAVPLSDVETGKINETAEDQQMDCECCRDLPHRSTGDTCP